MCEEHESALLEVQSKIENVRSEYQHTTCTVNTLQQQALDLQQRLDAANELSAGLASALEEERAAVVVRISQCSLVTSAYVFKIKYNLCGIL